MKEKNKIGLVIQGPLYSPGRSGANAHISEAELIEEDLVKYNCVHNIIKLFSEFRHQFDELEFVTDDMRNFQYKEAPDVVINTSTEHVDQDTYDTWWENIPDDTFVMLQGNDLVIPEHVRPFDSLDDFISRNRVKRNKRVVEMELPGPNDTTYKRFTLTGFK